MKANSIKKKKKSQNISFELQVFSFFVVVTTEDAWLQIEKQLFFKKLWHEQEINLYYVNQLRLQVSFITVLNDSMESVLDDHWCFKN